MIEPDINEQLGSLAPSQGNADLLQNVVSQESLSMTEAITPRRSFVLPTAPPQPQLDPALKAAVDEMANQRSAILNSSLYNATKKNPDTVAEAQRVGKQMGVGADIAERNLPELQRGAMMLKALDRNLAISAPKTANSLTEPDFANIAYDDLENLTGTEKLMNWFAGTDFFKGAQGTFISTEMATIDQLNSEGMATSKDFERYRELQRDLQIVGQPAPYSISGNIANLLASVEAGAEIGAQYAVTGAVLGGAAGAIGGPLAPATMPAGMALGGTAGFATGMAKWMYQSMAGESYRQLREGDVSHEVALPMSRGIGVITSALEFAGLGAELYIASGVGKKIFAKELATDVTAELSKQMIKKATASEAVWDASKLYFGEILTESTVEGLQTAITRVGTEIGRAYDRPDLQNMFQTPEGRRAIISEAVDSFVNVAIGMSVAGLPLPAANYYMDRGRYADAKRSQQFYEDLSKNAVDSKMRQRNPDAAERFYADQVDGTGAETTYVDGRVMQNILNQSGLTNEQVDTVLPGIRQQLAEAISIGGDVTIPTATYAARLAGTKLGDSMKIHMRPNANAWSADTAVKYAGQLEQEKEKALALLEEKETTDTAFVNEARVIEKDMQEKLAAVGRDPKLAKAEATIFRDMMVVAAAEAKMTPAAYMAQHGPKIVGPQAQQTVATLQQAQKPQVTIEGRSIPITIAIGQTGSGRELISIDTNKLDEAWLQSQNEFADSEYIGAGGTGTESTTPKKYSAFAKFQKTAKSIEGALVQIDDQGRVKFQNGRHRFAYMRDNGVTSIPVVMDAESRANAEKFGYISAPTFLEQAAISNAGPIEAAKQLVEEAGRESFNDIESFFAEKWPALLSATGKQLDLDEANFQEAAKRGISDLSKFIADNPKFADYYKKDWELTRNVLSDFYGRQITDDEFVMFRTIAGLTSPNTTLPLNISDTVNFFDWWIKNGNFDAVKLGPKPETGTIVLLEKPFSISGTTGNIKARSIKVVEELVKRFGNAVDAIEFLQEMIPVGELHKFNKEMGYAGSVSNIGNIRSLVKQATGQDLLIPRMFIFGQKVGAYTLNAVGDSRYTTVDIWESRFIRSYFTGMFAKNTGLPVDSIEHDVFTRFNEVFKEEFEKETGKSWEPSALQAMRWFYIIDAAKQSGYSRASTNETISFYTERKLQKSYGYGGYGIIDSQGRSTGDGASSAGIEGQQILEQATVPGPARGGYDPKRIEILLNSEADAFTFLHELMHWRMDKMIQSVNNGKASPQEIADLDIMIQSFKLGGESQQERLAIWNAMTFEEQRPHWEAIAYNFENYLFEGKAPSVEMQGVFDRMASFIKRVYVSIRDDLNKIYRREFGKDLPVLTDEVRGVMDRMLASEDQIKRKQAMMQMVPMFLTQEESGMDDATYAAYQAMNKEAEDAAVTDLTKASLKQMQWLSGARSRVLKELQAKHDALRKEIRAEVKAEVDAEPIYAAMSILKTGEGRAKNGEMVKFDDKFKLNLESVKKMIPAEDVAKLGFGKYGMVAADGMDPDMAADMFGFSSGDELVLALLSAKPAKEEINARTDKRMMDENGDMNTPQSQEEAVQRALHNEARFRFNAVEVRWLSKATTPVRVFMDAAKLAAQQIIAGKVISKLRPSEYQAAEAKAAREAADAHSKRRTAAQAAQAATTKERNAGLSGVAAGVPMSEVEAAAAAKGQEAAQKATERESERKAKYGERTPEQVILRAKQIQLLQNQLAREAQDAKDEVAKTVKDFRKFFKADDKLAKTRNMDLVDAARAILSAFGFGKSDKSPIEYIEKLKAYNPVMYAAIEPIVTASISKSKNYKDLTVEEFRQVREVVDVLLEQSRRDKFVEIEGKMVAVADLVDQLETRLDEIGVPKNVIGDLGAATYKERRILDFYDAKAAIRRVEHWADATDGAKGVGPFTKYIWRPVKDAINAYRMDRNKYVLKYVQLLKQIVLPVGKIESKELNYTFGNGKGGVGKAELLGALMHTGNDSNMRKMLLGRGWATLNEDGTLDTSRWDAFVARMIKQGVLTKSDFEFVQATWDLCEEIKPIAQKAHRAIFGFYFKEIQATSFTNEFGTFRGGYVPAKTDAMIVRDAKRQSKMEELEGDFRNSMPSTGMGFTKSREEQYNEALSMDVRLVTKHIDDVLRFAHVQPAIKDVLKILKNRSFASKLTRIDPTVIDDMLIPWLNRSARQITSEPGRNKRMDKFWKGVRSRTGLSIMTANLRNALQQPTGFFPAMLKVSKTQLGNALLTYMGSPFKTAADVASLSTFMNERLKSQIFDMQDDINEILLNPNAYNKVQKWTNKHGYFLQSAFQNTVDVVTWTAKYNQVLAESKVGASDAKVQREAIQQADAAVRLTQGSMSAEDISASAVGSPFYKTFNQFGDYFNMLANLNVDEYIKVVRDLGWRGNKGKLLNIYILGFMAPALVADAIARSMGGDWDPDDDGYLDDFMDWFFGSQARAAVAMVPFGSAAATAVTTAFNSKAYDDRITASPSIAALEAATIGVGKTVINIADDDKDVTGKNVRDVTTLISLATGIPVTVLGRPVGYLVDVNRKKAKPTGPIDVARGLVTGVAKEKDKK